MGASAQPLEVFADLVRQVPPGLRGEIPRDDRLAERGEVVVEHVRLDPPQGMDDRRYLLRDFEAVAPGRDHLLEPAHLPFDAP